MAQSTQSKKKTNNSAKTKSKSKAGTGGKAKAKAKEEAKPRRREICAIVFALMTLLAGLGVFITSDAFLLVAIRRFFSGLYGYGFYLLPLAFGTVAVVQGFHKGRPVAWRTTAALLDPAIFGAFANLLFASPKARCGNIITLYSCGADVEGSGIISGLLSYYGEMALSVWGAAIVFIIVFILLTLAMFNTNIIKLIKWFRDRERVEYDEYEPEPEPEPVALPEAKGKKRRGAKGGKESDVFDITTDLDDVVIPADRREKPVARRSEIDIPIDGETPDSEDKLFSKKKKKKAAPKSDELEPVSFEEAAAIAGVSAPVSLSGSGSTEAGEISDPPKKKMSAAELAAETAAIVSSIENAEDGGDYEIPPIYLLKKGHATAANADNELRMTRDRLESTIKSFGVNANIVDITRGPSITRFDMALEQGVKLNKITNLSGDIALALGVDNVRIAPVPEKSSTVGIEVPNKIKTSVYLRDIIDSPKFANAKKGLNFAVGKDISGEPIIGNISKLPHMLIAGTTGSGKSVFMNSIIISLLYKYTPDEVKFIMVDPKMVEFDPYNGIPHLYIPVVTDPKKAAGALQWAVTEMLKRYRLFKETKVRNIASYNEYLEANGEPKIPNVVVFIDELADLMLVASKEVEDSICRVAQMGRAAGMHLVIATQRPSSDVITGLMKANIPSRVALSVQSALDSRIILDNGGAEKLIGNGDMLYLPIGSGKPMRIQGTFVSDEEIKAICDFLRDNSTVEYREDIMAQIDKAAEDKNSGGKGSDSADSAPANDYDELLPQAVDVIFDTKQASVSMLQRRLKLGYSRAARIVDQMEELGIIGPFEGSKPRQIIITRDQWLEMQAVQGTAPTEVLETQMEFADEIDSEF